VGRRLTLEQRQERRELKRLISKIRRTKRYARWKDKILHRDVKSYPDIPKGVQVHHRIEISKLIKKFEITSVREALDCLELWKLPLGICLKRGEHFIFTKLGRYKYLTKGFRELLTEWLRRTYEDKLDANHKRKSKKDR